MNPNQEVPVAGKIEIILYANGQITVTQKTPNWIITDGMIEQAKKLLAGMQAEQAKQAQGGLEVVPPALVNRLGNHGRNGG